MLLSGCMVLGEQYAYKPQTAHEKMATIQHVFGVNPKQEYNFILGEDINFYDYAIMVREINGTQVKFWKSNKEINNNQIKLSPGRTEFTFVLSEGNNARGNG